MPNFCDLGLTPSHSPSRTNLIMKTRTHLAVLSLAACLLLVNYSLALTPFADDFGAAKLNTTRWKLITESGVKLLQADGRLNFTASSKIWDWSHAEVLLRNNQPGYNENWEVIVDVTYLNTPSPNLGFTVFNADDSSDQAYFQFQGKAENGGGFYAYFTENGINLGDMAWRNPQVPKGSIRIGFDRISKLLTLYYDKTGSADGYKWVKFCNYSTNGSGGDIHGNWKMNAAGGRFGLKLRGSACFAIPNGKLSFNNFILRTPK